MIILEFDTLDELYQHYMPFLQYGGLFYASPSAYTLGEVHKIAVLLPDALEPHELDAQVAWITPANTQSNGPQGVGFAFTEADQGLRDIIEKLLGNKLTSDQFTHTF